MSTFEITVILFITFPFWFSFLVFIITAPICLLTGGKFYGKLIGYKNMPEPREYGDNEYCQAMDGSWQLCKDLMPHPYD